MTSEAAHFQSLHNEIECILLNETNDRPQFMDYFPKCFLPHTDLLQIIIIIIFIIVVVVAVEELLVILLLKTIQQYTLSIKYAYQVWNLWHKYQIIN